MENDNGPFEVVKNRSSRLPDGSISRVTVTQNEKRSDLEIETNRPDGTRVTVTMNSDRESGVLTLTINKATAERITSERARFTPEMLQDIAEFIFGLIDER